jgi:hypothetical protein
MLERYLFGNSGILFEISANATTMAQVRKQIVGICNPIKMWLPKRKLTEPALFKHVDLNGVRIASSSGFDGIKFHFRGHPTFRQLILLRGMAELQCRGQSFQHSATL